jgi:hypothetical protein
MRKATDLIVVLGQLRLEIGGVWTRSAVQENRELTQASPPHFLDTTRHDTPRLPQTNNTL